jgi:hypothetical protein
MFHLNRCSLHFSNFLINLLDQKSCLLVVDFALVLHLVDELELLGEDVVDGSVVLNWFDDFPKTLINILPQQLLRLVNRMRYLLLNQVQLSIHEVFILIVHVGEGSRHAAVDFMAAVDEVDDGVVADHDFVEHHVGGAVFKAVAVHYAFLEHVGFEDVLQILQIPEPQIRIVDRKRDRLIQMEPRLRLQKPLLHVVVISSSHLIQNLVPNLSLQRRYRQPPIGSLFFLFGHNSSCHYDLFIFLHVSLFVPVILVRHLGVIIQRLAAF